jgi:predicted transcriptional regulator
LLIYLLWKTGRLSNKEIGNFFGLTYSAVSRYVKAINYRISAEPKIKEKYQNVKSLIKVLPLSHILSSTLKRITDFIIFWIDFSNLSVVSHKRSFSMLYNLKYKQSRNDDATSNRGATWIRVRSQK